MRFIKTIKLQALATKLLVLLFVLSMGLNGQVQKTKKFSRLNTDVQDSEIFRFRKLTNYGGETVLKVSPINSAGNRRKRRTLIKFDISEIPSQAIITKAQLILQKENWSNKRVLRVHKITSDWKENTVTWKNFSNSFNPTVTSSRKVKYEADPNHVNKHKVRWNVLNDVQKMVSGNLPKYQNKNLIPVLFVKWELPQNLEISSTLNPLCTGGTSKLTASGGSNYLWKVNGVEISKDASLFVSPSKTTTYDLLANVNGSLVSKSITINVNTTPSIILNTSKSTNNCSGEIEAITTGNIVQFYWAKDGMDFPSLNKNIIGLCEGNYTLKVTDANGCLEVDTFFCDKL